MTELDKDSVRAFLREFKRLAKEKRLFVIHREENNQALLDLGVTAKIRVKELLALSVLDYSSGPDPDHDMSGNVWTFGKMIDSVEVYIKLKVAETPNGPVAKCLSFHKAREPLKYPFRDQV